MVSISFYEAFCDEKNLYTRRVETGLIRKWAKKKGLIYSQAKIEKEG